MAATLDVSLTPATLRSRGRIYGAQIRQVYQTLSGATLEVVLAVADWRSLRPTRDRAPRNDIELDFTMADGSRVWCHSGRDLQLAEVEGGAHTVVARVSYLAGSWTITAVPLEHRPVCAGCHQPWPCPAAS